MKDENIAKIAIMIAEELNQDTSSDWKAIMREEMGDLFNIYEDLLEHAELQTTNLSGRRTV